ncbi:hypothetical protein IJG14_03355, partial [bacterium]|nr:hypothetical protein [bacterium]
MDTTISQIKVNNTNNQISKNDKKESKPVLNSQQIDTNQSPTGDFWKAVYGISVKEQIQQANKLINKFALTVKLGIHDICNLKKIINNGSEQAENIAMLLSLVNSKDVNPKTLKYVCENGMMSDGMEKDIRMIFNSKQNGINPNDAYIPHYLSQNEAVLNSETGDLFEIEGQNNIFIKNKDGKAEQLKMDKEMMIKLFPPAERFANAQTYSADCYFVSAINSMMDSPEARAYFLQCFEQDGDDIKITFPSDNFQYTAKDAKMPKTY